MLRPAVLLLFLLSAKLSVAQQPVEGIIVETVHAQPSGNGSDTLFTYRIHVDLAPDHALQVVFGETGHSLRFETSTVFHNTQGSVIYAERLAAGPDRSEALLSDSWFAMGKVGNDHVGVLRTMDNDGSIMKCPKGVKKSTDHLCRKDGLMPTMDTRSTVNYFMESGYLLDLPGSVIETTDGAWAVLGGMKGATPENTVLIAQLVTTGTLHFTLNLQVGLPDGNFVRVVAKNPGEGELYFEGLTYGLRKLN